MSPIFFLLAVLNTVAALSTAAIHVNRGIFDGAAVVSTIRNARSLKMVSDPVSAPKCNVLISNPALSKTIRRAEFWDGESATLADIINVLGRWESSSEWKERTEFTENVSARESTTAQAATYKRYEMAQRMGVVERVAFQQNIPKLPFRNDALASSFGLGVEDFNQLAVKPEAVNIVYDALAQSKSSLIPPNVIDTRRNSFLTENGGFNEANFSIALYKSRMLVILSWFVFGKGNFFGLLVLLKVLSDSLGLGKELLDNLIEHADLLLLGAGAAFAMASVGQKLDGPDEA
mmetsp:Transcript_13943/g.29995  ORF Transcript_13943/g.29995 Transcript_13943/m.29995 type:complete len:290 (-) Transcript_13943:465-1334(-)